MFLYIFVTKRAYSCEFLLDVSRITFLELNSTHAEELRDLSLLRRPTPSPTPTTASHPQRKRYKWRERKQKRGKRGESLRKLFVLPQSLGLLYFIEFLYLLFSGHRITGDSNFFKIWKKVCPFIITAKPMTDLCWVCQENNSLIFRSANLTDAQKRDRVAQQEKH